MLSLSLAALTLAAPAFADEPSKTTEAKPAAATEAKGGPGGSPPAGENGSEPTVLLHVNSDEVVSIEREDTGVVVCSSPCDQQVPATVRYRIGGTGRPSKVFTLDGRNGQAKITVSAATKRGYHTGIAVMGAGGALLVGGIVALALGYANQSPVPGADGEVTDTTYSDTMILGTTLVVAGVAAGIYGGATFVSNLESNVKGNIVKDPPASGHARPNRTADAILPATFSVPLLKGTF